MRSSIALAATSSLCDDGQFGENVSACGSCKTIVALVIEDEKVQQKRSLRDKDYSSHMRQHVRHVQRRIQLHSHVHSHRILELARKTGDERLNQMIQSLKIFRLSRINRRHVIDRRRYRLARSVRAIVFAARSTVRCVDGVEIKAPLKVSVGVSILEPPVERLGLAKKDGCFDIQCEGVGHYVRVSDEHPSTEKTLAALSRDIHLRKYFPE